MGVLSFIGKLLSTGKEEPPATAEPRRPMRCGTPYIWMGWVPPNRSESGKWEPPEGRQLGSNDD